MANYSILNKYFIFRECIVIVSADRYNIILNKHRIWRETSSRYMIEVRSVLVCAERLLTPRIFPIVICYFETSLNKFLSTATFPWKLHKRKLTKSLTYIKY